MDFRERLVYKLSICDDWRIVDEVDEVMYIYDHLPKRLKIVFEMKYEGKSAKEISDIIKRPVQTVYRQVRDIKKRVLRAERVI